MPCQGMCTDFPPTPVTVGTVPGNAAEIFGTPGSGVAGGPCLIEPQDNTLFPNNWLRPRFRFTGGAGLYEIRLHAANQANDLVVYTTNTTWTMDKKMWTALAVHTRDMPIEVTVRSAPPGGGQVLLGSKVHFTIAPVAANGKLVYWSTSGTTYFNGQPTGTETVLNGFAVGDESVVEVLRPYMGATSQVAMRPTTRGRTSARSSASAATRRRPTVSYIAFNDFYPWGAVLASGHGAGGHGAARQHPRRRRPQRDHAAVGRHHHLLAGPLDHRRSHHGRAARHLQRCSALRPARQRPATWTSSRAWPGSTSRARPRRLDNGVAPACAARPGTGSTRRWRALYAAAPSWSHDGTQGAVHDDRQGEVGPPRDQRERAPLHGAVFEDRPAGGDAGPGRRLARPARRSTTARCRRTTR